jgi:Predicted S-adenosylmethionine-dependent methyltransferase involved in cell envelope biogenesis
MAGSINTIAHEWMETILTPNSVAVDATAGNGKDTYFLARRCQKVYAFDIQTQAIENSKNYNKDFTNISYLCDSHENMNAYVLEKVDLIIFNLGYLPGSNHDITTNATSTKKALRNSMEILKPNGSIIITSYIGHPGGLEEYHEVRNEATLLQLKLIKTFQYENVSNSPILLHFKK